MAAHTKPGRADRANFHPESGSDQDATHPPRTGEGATDREGPTTSRTDARDDDDNPNARRSESDAMKD